MADARRSIVGRARRAMRQPAVVRRYLHRMWRNRKLRRHFATHPEFYRAVMADDVKRRQAFGAVGTESPDRWKAIGRKQFRFLRDTGLLRRHHMLEIGCGNLRAGRHFIRFLRAGHYTGVDVSPDILLAAQETISRDQLQDKRPALYLVGGSSLDFLPDEAYDVVHAHSVFTHTPLHVIEAYFAAAFRVMVPGGIFDFTYHHTDDQPWNVLEEDFYFATSLLLERAAVAGFEGRRMDEWAYSQEKIRLTKPG